MPSNPQIIDVRSTYFAGAGPNLGTAFSPDPVAGGAILVSYACFGGPYGILAPDDNYGNTYIPLGSVQTTPSSLEMQLWIATNIATGPGHQVEGNLTNSPSISIVTAWALDFTDVDNGDYTVTHIAGGAPASVGPSSPTPSPDSIMIAFYGNLDGGTLYGSPTGWNTIADGFASGMDGSGRAILHHGFFDANQWSAYKITSSVETALWQANNGFVEAIAYMVSISFSGSVGPTATGDMLLVF